MLGLESPPDLSLMGWTILISVIGTTVWWAFLLWLWLRHKPLYFDPPSLRDTDRRQDVIQLTIAAHVASLRINEAMTGIRDGLQQDQEPHDILFDAGKRLAWARNELGDALRDTDDQGLRVVSRDPDESDPNGGGG